jgi:hypothetical protein
MEALRPRDRQRFVTPFGDRSVNYEDVAGRPAAQPRTQRLAESSPPEFTTTADDDDIRL